MYKIYKERIDGIGIQKLQLPVDATVLCVQNQGEYITLWYEFGINEDGTALFGSLEWSFGVYGTGRKFDYPAGSRSFIGSVQLACGEIWHVYQLNDIKGIT